MAERANGLATRTAIIFRYGVRLDEPAGKNDGTVDGHQYFKCEPSHGVLVKPDKVTADPFA